MKVLVTGAAGFIGSHAAEALSSHGYQVVGLDNFSDYYDVNLKVINAQSLSTNNIEVIRIDLTHPEELGRLDYDFDFIMHFAAQPGISASSTFDQYLNNNVFATYNLIEFAINNKSLKHFFYISTSSVYGLEATCPETTAPQPASWYGVTKLAAEQLVLAETRVQRLNASSLRLYSVYGPRERPEKLYTKLIACALKNERFPLFSGSEDHLRSYTYVGDIIDGILSAVQKHQALNGEIINLGTEAEYTTREGIGYVEELLGKKIEFDILPPRQGDQLRTRANIEKAKQVLNYHPSTGLREGLALQVEWYKDNFVDQ